MECSLISGLHAIVVHSFIYVKKFNTWMQGTTHLHYLEDNSERAI